MHIVFIVVAGLLGLWIGQGVQAFFGWIIGMLIGSLLWRLSEAGERIERLSRRIDDLEMLPTQRATIAKAEAKVPQRVSVYEPDPVPEPEPEPEPVPEPEVVAEIKTPDLPTPPVVPPEPKPVPIVHARVPAAPQPPGMGQHAFEVAKRWLTTGNLAVKIGVIISFFGVAFLLKYAVDTQVLRIPIGVRYLGVAGFAAVLLVLGWRMRSGDRTYALSLQGGGIGVLYLVVFAALRIHELLPPVLAFALLVLITAAAGYLAIVQESRAFAILGTTGGFAAPLLISTGVGSYVALFGYYLVLNSAVLGIAWYRAWRELNIIGFVFTFGVGTLWGLQYYTPDKFASVEPFLVAYFLFYTAIAVLFAFRQKPELRGYVDGTLLFGTPTISFGLQSQLVNNTEYGLSISAAAVAVFYALMVIWLRQRKEKSLALLTQSFIALSVAFGTVAIPLALDDRYTALAWVMEGAALVWIGVRQNGTLPKLSGTVLAFAGGLAFLNYGWINDLGMPVFNGNYLGGVIIALTSLYSSRMLLTDEDGRSWQKEASVALLVWGLLWWFGAGLAEIADRASGSAQLYAGLLYFAGSFAVMDFAARRLEWLALQRITLIVLPFAGGAALFKYGWTYDLGMPILNGNVLGGAIMAATGLYSSRMLLIDERGDDGQKSISVALLVWGLAWWFGAGYAEIADRAIGSTQLYAGVVFFAFNFAAMNLAAKRLEWLALQRITFLFLPFAGGVALLKYGWIDDLGMPVLNGNVMAGAVVALAALYSSRMLLENYRDREWQKTASLALLVWGMLWWFGTGTVEADDRVPQAYDLHFLLLFYSASFVAMTDVAKRYRWAEMSRATQAILPLSLVMAYAYLANYGHLFVGVWSLAWIAAIAAYVWTLYARKSERNRDESFMHGAGAVFLAAILTHEVYWQVDQVVANDVWPISAGLLVLVAAAFAYSSKKARSVWPFSDNAIVYHQVSSGLIVMNLFLLIIVCIESSGSTSPLPYIPILNPFDMLSITGLAVAWLVAQATPSDSAWRRAAESKNLLNVLGGLAFVLSTYAVLRAVHHFTGVDWERHALMGSVSVQSTLTIYWALLSLAAMEVGQRKSSRGLWMVGAALMGVVVAKLFVVDLGNSGTVARIVSFLGVGVMLLVVGYFSPVPPKKSSSS